LKFQLIFYTFQLTIFSTRKWLNHLLASLVRPKTSKGSSTFACRLQVRIVYSLRQSNKYFSEPLIHLFAASEDAPSSGAFESMDPEKQRWLQEALSNMTVDVVKELTNCIVALRTPHLTVDSLFQSVSSKLLLYKS